MMTDLKKCPICGGDLQKRTFEEFIEGFYLGSFIGDQCTKCNERFYYEDIMEAITRKKISFKLTADSSYYQLHNITPFMTVKDGTYNFFEIITSFGGWVPSTQFTRSKTEPISLRC